MEKKYKITGETKAFLGRTLNRIQAVRDFGNISKGTLGGWIENEYNLSHNNDCWVSDNARVCGNALVYGDARVYGNACVFNTVEVSGNARVYGNAHVSDTVKVYGNARVSGRARVYGNAQVSDNAHVYGNAQVSGNAQVGDNAKVKKVEHVIAFENVGSRNDTLTAFRTKTGFLIKIGCFLGSLSKFLKAVEETHGDSKIGQEYKLIAEVIKVRFEEEE